MLFSSFLARMTATTRRLPYWPRSKGDGVVSMGYLRRESEAAARPAAALASSACTTA
jgi:hypothetical protein